MDLQVGRSGQTRTDTSGRRSRYRSWVGMARATWWPSGRWRVRASGYWSDSERMASAPGYRGTGGRVALQFHPSARWTVGADAGLERIGYRYEATDWLLDPGRANRLMAEGGLRVTRRLGERVELFAQTRLLASGLRRPTDGPSWDRRARGGIRIELQGTLWREESARQPSGWRMEDGTLRLEVPYEGPGRLYLTGSFNQWAEPGRPLRSTERGTYVITTEVPPGRHEFAIRVEGDEERSWLELPDGIPTVQDGFGRENGVLYASDG